jgi:hypothetical protein
VSRFLFSRNWKTVRVCIKMPIATVVAAASALYMPISGFLLVKMGDPAWGDICLVCSGP